MTKSKKSGKTKSKVQTAPVVSASAMQTDVAVERKLTSNTGAAKLRPWNMWLAVLYGAQGLAILVLAAAHAWSVTTNYLSKDPIASQIAGHPVLVTATKQLFSVNVALLVAAFLFVAAIAHLAAATKHRAQYEADLRRRINRLRWIAYGIGGGIAVVVVGLLSGVSDVSSLGMLFVLSVVAASLGMSIELHTGKARTMLYWAGCLVGLVPWAVLAMYVYGAQIGGGHVPGYLYAIYASMFVLSALLAVNLCLLSKQRGRWADYLYGERAFIVLSLVAVTALAWQVFAGALRP
jgi:hypothetical protein